MAKVSAIAVLRAKEGRGDDLAAGFASACALVGSEPGTEHYVLHRSSTDPRQFWVVEVYSDQAALDAHMAGEGMKALGAALGDTVESFDLQFANPVAAAKGMEL